MDELGLREFIKDRDGLLSIVEQLRGGAKERWSFALVQSAVTALLEEYGLNQTYTLPIGATWHRARKLDGCARECWPSSKEGLGPRKSEDVRDFGRCHSPQQSIGYFSLYEDIALTEIDAEVGDCVIISTFRLASSLVVVPIGEFDHFRRTGETHLGSAVPSATEAYRAVLEPDDVEGKCRAFVDAFFADEFIRPATLRSHYKITSAISAFLFDHPRATVPIDAIFFPSVAYRAGSNLAIRGESVEKKMELQMADTKVFKVVDSWGYGIFDLEELAVIVAIDGDLKLEWQ